MRTTSLLLPVTQRLLTKEIAKIWRGCNAGCGDAREAWNGITTKIACLSGFLSLTDKKIYTFGEIV
jgi:hypothetical protein